MRVSTTAIILLLIITTIIIMDVVFIVILNAVWRHLVAMHAHVIPSFRWRILKSSMESCAELPVHCKAPGRSL